MAKYRLLKGKHSVRDKVTGERIVYTRGDIVETDTDLLKMNSGLGPIKFEQLPDHPPHKEIVKLDAHVVKEKELPSIISKEDKNKLFRMLDGKTFKELQEFATEHKIDVKGIGTKDDLLKHLKLSL